jgi:hypothetical protein
LQSRVVNSKHRKLKLIIFGIAVIVLAGILVSMWMTRCFKETVVTEGSHLGLQVGSDKAHAFEQLLRLKETGVIGGFWGIDEQPGSAPRRYEWTAESSEDDFNRLELYESWRLYDPTGKILGAARFQGGTLGFVDTYDEHGYLLNHAPAWSPSPTAPELTRGISPTVAVAHIRDYLSAGFVNRIESTEHDVVPPSRMDATAFSFLEPWNKWGIATEDWGGAWVTFEQDRLVRIHHRVQCVELP